MGLAVYGGLADADALARAAGFARDIVSAQLFFTCSCAVYAKVQHALNSHLPAVAFPVFSMRARRHAPGRVHATTFSLFGGQIALHCSQRILASMGRCFRLWSSFGALLKQSARCNTAVRLRSRFLGIWRGRLIRGR